MRSKLLSAAAMALALMGGQGVAYAQARPPVSTSAQESLSRTQRDAVLAAIRQSVQSSYIFPDRAPGMLARLDAAVAEGRYDVSSPNELAGLITGDLREASQDGHVYLEYAPDRYVATVAAAAPVAQTLSQIDAAVARRDNHGLTASEILSGNVRYLKIAAFQWVSDETGRAYDDAMRFLKGGDAAIIDLRGNGGGYSEAVQYLVSHFLKAGTLEITFLQAGREPVQTRALDYLPAGRLTAPLYVLIDQASASAAESFAYDVQQFKLGRLVGTGTAGAANNNEFTPIAPGFMLSLSVGRPVHPVSGSNWEGVGVVPDTLTPSPQALDTAHAEALRLLSSTATSDAAKADYAWALTAVEAKLNPPVIGADLLQSAPGAYRNYVVMNDGGALVVGRPGHPLWPEPRRLSPLTSNGLFAVDGLDILRVSFRDGAMQLWWKDESAPRVIPRN